MAETEKTDEPKGSEELINLKAEMNRKLDNAKEEHMNELRKVNDNFSSILTQLNTNANQRQTASTAEEPKLADMIYDNPEKATQLMEQRAEKRALDTVRKEMDARAAAQNKQSTVLNQLVSDYPELNNASHELTTKAVEIYNKLPEEERANPLSYKVAVKDAASELGYKPYRLRDEDDTNDNFSLGSGIPRPGKKDAIKKGSQRMLEIAQLFHMDVGDKKVVERLQKRQERGNFGSYKDHN